MKITCQSTIFTRVKVRKDGQTDIQKHRIYKHCLTMLEIVKNVVVKHIHPSTYYEKKMYIKIFTAQYRKYMEIFRLKIKKVPCRNFYKQQYLLKKLSKNYNKNNKISFFVTILRFPVANVIKNDKNPI